MDPREEQALAAITSAWEAELERLEDDVRRTEQLIADPTEALLSWHARPTWHAPSLGPVPEHLRPRAEALLAHQAELRGRLTQALASLTRQREFTERVGDATASAPAGPTYLDVTA